MRSSKSQRRSAVTLLQVQVSHSFVIAENHHPSAPVSEPELAKEIPFLMKQGYE